MHDQRDACPQCGGPMTDLFDTAGVLAACDNCGGRICGVSDPALPEWEPGFREAVLVLDFIGPSPLQVASILRAATGLTPGETLALVHSERPALVRCEAFELRKVEELQSKLATLGAVTTIHKLQ